ncbi:MATE efflux family protein 6 [Morus notabilis]|uniref:Protein DETOXIFICATION n=2 Tax=Morus notabilis TaxID=981085 RepID=W9QE39_9ROSA|nr:protein DETOXIFICATION 16 [Morus notabilis]EXB30269.1 MATE efflux family protein 6 [Morus notabilis]
MERENYKPSLVTPLIQSCEENGLNNGRDRVGEEGIKRKQILEEVKRQLWLAGPLIAVSLLQYCLQMISVMFVGHLGELSLSGASMATSFAAVTGFSFLLGMASALETLSGQSYGAKQYHMLGIHTQRSMFVLLLVSIPLAVIWANTEPILIAVGQDADIATEAGRYARFMIPSIFAYGLLQCLVKFLQTQNIVFPMVVSSGIATLLHILLCWVLVFKSGLGSKGAALANSISYWNNVLLLALYVKFSSSCAKTWTGFSKEAFENTPTFVRLAIPSAVMVCLEMWSFEMVVLLSGLLPNPELETSVLSISLNTASTVWMIPFGLSGAVSTRVSNELGAGHPGAARLAVWVAVVMTVTEALLVGLVLILIRNIWGYAYSNEIEVVKYVAKMMPILAGSHFLEGLQCVLSGNARGCGWQKIGAYVNLGSYYIVGIPSAILLAFVFHIGGKGLWLGIICALVVQSLFLLVISINTNWEEQANKAKERVYKSVAPVEAVS